MAAGQAQHRNNVGRVCLVHPVIATQSQSAPLLIFMSLLREPQLRAGGMAHLLRACAVLAEDLGSAHSAHTCLLTVVWNSSPRG